MGHGGQAGAIASAAQPETKGALCRGSTVGRISMSRTQDEPMSSHGRVALALKSTGFPLIAAASGSGAPVRSANRPSGFDRHLSAGGGARSGGANSGGRTSGTLPRIGCGHAPSVRMVFGPGEPFVSGRRCSNSPRTVGPARVAPRRDATKEAAAVAHSSPPSPRASSLTTYDEVARGGVALPTGHHTDLLSLIDDFVTGALDCATVRLELRNEHQLDPHREFHELLPVEVVPSPAS
jgi:hypothetical protein